MKNIASGTSDDTFSHDTKITRHDMAAIIVKFMDQKDYELAVINELKQFIDKAETSKYAKDAVSKMQLANVVNGNGNNDFTPQDTATRA